MLFWVTEKEVFAALEEFELSDQKEEVKFWYDGFMFGKHADIYNPWSICNFLDTGEFMPYWVNTSSNSLVSRLIQESEPEIKMQMEDLMQDKSLCMELDEELIFESKET